MQHHQGDIASVNPGPHACATACEYVFLHPCVNECLCSEIDCSVPLVLAVADEVGYLYLPI